MPDAAQTLRVLPLASLSQATAPYPPNGMLRLMPGPVPDGSAAMNEHVSPKRRKQGRIVSGAAAARPTGEVAYPWHRWAKTVTRCAVNRWGDSPDTPPGSGTTSQ